jgi:hypothetical protein
MHLENKLEVRWRKVHIKSKWIKWQILKINLIQYLEN